LRSLPDAPGAPPVGLSGLGLGDDAFDPGAPSGAPSGGANSVVGAPGGPPPPPPPPGPAPDWAESLDHALSDQDAEVGYDTQQPHLDYEEDEIAGTMATLSHEAAPTPKQGWLWKANQNGKNYKKRWVAVADGQFLYRKKEDRKVKWIKEPENLKEAELNPRAMDGSSGFPSKPKTKYGFRIKIPGRMYFFCADDETIEEAWLEAFRQHIDFARVPGASRQAPAPPPTGAQSMLDPSSIGNQYDGLARDIGRRNPGDRGSNTGGRPGSNDSGGSALEATINKWSTPVAGSPQQGEPSSRGPPSSPPPPTGVAALRGIREGVTGDDNNSTASALNSKDSPTTGSSIKVSEFSGKIMAKVPKPSATGGGFFRKQFQADEMAEATAWVTQKEAEALNPSRSRSLSPGRRGSIRRGSVRFSPKQMDSRSLSPSLSPESSDSKGTEVTSKLPSSSKRVSFQMDRSTPAAPAVPAALTVPAPSTASTAPTVQLQTRSNQPMEQSDRDPTQFSAVTADDSTPPALTSAASAATTAATSAISGLPSLSSDEDDEMMSFFLVMTESHKETERQFEMTIPEAEADRTTVLDIKQNISHMLTPEGTPPLDVRRIELTMNGHPCRDDFMGIEFGLSEGTIFECHLRDDVGYGATEEVVASLATTAPATTPSARFQTNYAAATAKTPTLSSLGSPSSQRRSPQRGSPPPRQPMSLPLEPMMQPLRPLGEVLEVEIMIGDTPAPKMLQIDPRRETPEVAAQKFCKENHLPVVTVAPLVAQQVRKLLGAIQDTVGRQESMRTEIAILHEQMAMGDPLTKTQIDAQKSRYEYELAILRKKLATAEKRATDSERKCSQVLAELDALKSARGPGAQAMPTAFNASITSAPENSPLRSNKKPQRRGSVQFGGGKRRRRRSIKKVFGRAGVGEKVSAFTVASFVPPSSPDSDNQSKGNDNNNNETGKTSDAPVEKIYNKRRDQSGARRHRRRSVKKDFGQVHPGSKDVPVVSRVEIDMAVAEAKTMDEAEITSLKKKVKLLERRLNSEESSMEKHSTAELMRKLSAEMAKSAKIPLLETELQRAEKKLKTLQETEIPELKEKFKRAQATITDLEHNSKPAPTSEEEHAWSEAARQASELVRSTAAEAEEARQATREALEERDHIEALAKEKESAQVEHIAKLKNEVLDMHKEITYLHSHLRHQKKDLKDDKVAIKNAKARSAAQSLKNVFLQKKNQKAHSDAEETQHQLDEVEKDKARTMKTMHDEIGLLKAKLHSEKAKMDEIRMELESEKKKVTEANEKVEEANEKVEAANHKLSALPPPPPATELAVASGAAPPPRPPPPPLPPQIPGTGVVAAAAAAAEVNPKVHRKLKMRLILLRVAHEFKVERIEAQAKTSQAEVNMLKGQLADAVLAGRRASTLQRRGTRKPGDSSSFLPPPPSSLSNTKDKGKVFDKKFVQKLHKMLEDKETKIMELRAMLQNKDKNIVKLKEKISSMESSFSSTGVVKNSGNASSLSQNVGNAPPSGRGRGGDLADVSRPSPNDSEEVVLLKTKLREVGSRLKASRMIQGDDESMPTSSLNRGDARDASSPGGLGRVRVARGVSRSEWRKFAEEKRAMLEKFNRDRQKLVDEIRRLRDMIDPKQRPEAKMETANAEIARLRADVNSERMKRQASDSQVQQMAQHLRNLERVGSLASPYGGAGIAAAKQAGTSAVDEQLRRANAEILRLHNEQNRRRAAGEPSNWQFERENLMKNWNEVSVRSDESGQRLEYFCFLLVSFASACPLPLTTPPRPLWFFLVFFTGGRHTCRAAESRASQGPGFEEPTTADEGHVISDTVVNGECEQTTSTTVQ
jgi:hypothetical protein